MLTMWKDEFRQLRCTDQEVTVSSEMNVVGKKILRGMGFTCLDLSLVRSE